MNVPNETILAMTSIGGRLPGFLFIPFTERNIKEKIIRENTPLSHTGHLRIPIRRMNQLTIFQ